MTMIQFFLKRELDFVYKNWVSGIISKCFQHRFAGALLLTALLSILLPAQPALAADYVDTFNGSCPWGSGQVSSFTTGTANTGLAYTFAADGDGGDFAWTSTGGNGDTGCINALSGAWNTGTTEKVTIVSRDGKAFVFDGIWFDIVGTGITVTGIGPEPFSFNGVNGANTPSGGSKLVTLVQMTSTDFGTDYIDNVNMELDVPGMAIYGNGQMIVNGDNTPAAGDHTDFGTVMGPAEKTFTISSIGDLNLDLTGAPYVTLTSNPSGKFSIKTQPTVDPIASGSSDTFVILCSPTEPGEITATVSIANNSEAAPYTFDIKCNGDASLPVEMASFTANVQGNAVVLTWQTASETDNLGFVLERAAGNNGWQPIASYKTDAALKGRSNSSTTTTYSFTDNTVSAGTEYRYRLGDVNVAGTITMHSPISVTTSALPQSTAMFNAYPNPFNPETTVKYTLHQDARVTIAVYDLLGRQVKTLIDEQQSAGAYHVVWNGMDAAGAKVSSGSYIIRMETENILQIQKIMLLK
ncbi:MAG TPA: choice-of-anchor D domain-containing protein [bacterium]|nr:choice-of-anchor D domain-containing protein [bacterium]HPN44680.1 choice-of-anchor D domain-containing protein [bacterium]